MTTNLPLHEFGTPSAPPVMLLHSGGTLHSVWLPLIRAWQTRYRLLAPDLLTPPKESVSLENLAQRVIALLQQHAQSPVWLVGASLGANVALLVTLHAPHLVAGLVLDSAQPGGPPPALLPGIIRLLKGVARLAPSAWVTTLLLKQFPHYTPTDQAALRVELETVGKLGFFEHAEAHFAYDVRHLLARIAVPTLILAGEQDMLTKAGAPNQLHTGIAGSVMHIIPQAGHVTFLQQPAHFEKCVTDFLTEKMRR